MSSANFPSGLLIRVDFPLWRFSSVREFRASFHSAHTGADQGCVSIVIATPWEVVIVFDTIVFILTLYKAVEMWRVGPSTLFQVLVRDGELVLRGW